MHWKCITAIITKTLFSSSAYCIHNKHYPRLWLVVTLDSLELLNTDKVVIALNSHGVDQFISTIHLSHWPGALLTTLLGILYSHYLPSFILHHCSHISPIRSCLLKLFTNLNRRNDCKIIFKNKFTLNLSSIDFRVVDDFMDQTPLFSVISTMGVETVAAFLRR